LQRLAAVAAVPIIVIGAFVSTSFLASCSGVNLERYNWAAERSAPLDCFADDAEGDNPNASTSALDVESISPPFDLSGVWAQQQVTSAIASAPLVGESITTSTNILRMELEQQGGRVTMTAQVCSITQQSTSNAGTTIVPQAFIDAIGLSDRSVTLVPTDSGYRFQQARYVRILGMDLEDDANEPIPTDENDPRVVDSDNDGHPGVTVVVEGIVDGQVYLVQRHWKELCGDVMSEDAVDGYIRWGTDQHVVAGSNFVLSRTPEAEPHPDWELNRFKLRRIDPTWTCDDIIANQETIFSEEQPDNQL